MADLGQLLRIKPMIDEVVKQEPIDSAATGLTDAYNRTRDAAQTLVDASPEPPASRRTETRLPVLLETSSVQPPTTEPGHYARQRCCSRSSVRSRYSVAGQLRSSASAIAS